MSFNADRSTNAHLARQSADGLVVYINKTQCLNKYPPPEPYNHYESSIVQRLHTCSLCLSCTKVSHAKAHCKGGGQGSGYLFK